MLSKGSLALLYAYLALKCARRVLFCITARSESAVTRYSVLGQCSLALWHDWRVPSCVTACTASAMLRYGVLGECNLVLRRAW